MNLKKLRQIIIAVIGFTVLTIGIIMIVFPGPAFIIIPIGLSILATEFVWAKKNLEKIKNKMKAAKDRFSENK
ncbi:MAG: PGPGW domain-containing protein [Ignavibacteriaceae bacterium]|nr:PGPGW domain-containing protein [Ignavibacteriaceae bacterium]